MTEISAKTRRLELATIWQKKTFCIPPSLYTMSINRGQHAFYMISSMSIGRFTLFSGLFLAISISFFDPYIPSFWPAVCLLLPPLTLSSFLHRGWQPTRDCHHLILFASRLFLALFPIFDIYMAFVWRWIDFALDTRGQSGHQININI